MQKTCGWKPDAPHLSHHTTKPRPRVKLPKVRAQFLEGGHTGVVHALQPRYRIALHHPRHPDGSIAARDYELSIVHILCWQMTDRQNSCLTEL